MFEKIISVTLVITWLGFIGYLAWVTPLTPYKPPAPVTCPYVDRERMLQCQALEELRAMDAELRQYEIELKTLRWACGQAPLTCTPKEEREIRDIGRDIADVQKEHDLLVDYYNHGPAVHSKEVKYR